MIERLEPFKMGRAIHDAELPQLKMGIGRSHNGGAGGSTTTTTT
jgi:hypothetical protein